MEQGLKNFGDHWNLLVGATEKQQKVYWSLVPYLLQKNHDPNILLDIHQYSTYHYKVLALQTGACQIYFKVTE